MAPELEHDPLCPRHEGAITCFCDLLALVRADERERIRVALAAVDLGGRAAARILALIEEREA